MFGYSQEGKSNFYEMNQLTLLLAIALLVVQVHAQGKGNCAANGEYCLTHSDCCSGSCLSFSYKCVPVPPSANIGTTYVPITVDTVNRFGGPNDSGTSITQKTCAYNGEYCQTHAECCSGSCLSFSYKCVPLNPPASGINTHSQPPTTTSVSINPPISTIEVNNRVGEVQSSTVAVNLITPSSKKCAALGEYCLTSSECCSKSCLSFSYKCVHNYDLGTQLLSTGIPIQQPSSNSAIDTTNRFGGTNQCIGIGLYCKHNLECCSGACYKSLCQTEIKLGVPESELTRPSISNGPYVEVSSLDELITRFGGTASNGSTSKGIAPHTSMIQARIGTAKQCRVVGDGCSRHQDCCSQRCHSYRGKCVS
ncbi:protein psiQ isoform X2 [Wyeomyia smithii]|uniref:protein psiQ isoform X2 n=1 Tax=Wyeomyia smithii TaxID=174621 RepID=UPI002467D057|nr:protein psiQ isoform X2 [Wyeomyia smithii]